MEKQVSREGPDLWEEAPQVWKQSWITRASPGGRSECSWLPPGAMGAEALSTSQDGAPQQAAAYMLSS